MNRIFIIIIALFFFTGKSYAQESKVAILARAQKGHILLRWAPTKAVVWQLANKYGYTLERHTILRDSILLQQVEKTVVGTFFPQPLAAWENKIDQDDYAAIAAQAIYGETFELTQNYSSDIMQVINKTKELDQRFSFALFAADQSFAVAKMEGLAFKDSLAKSNEKYLYKIYANIPISIDEVDSGTVYIGIADFAPLPKPFEVSARFGDGIVMLKWNREFFEQIYNGFIIERSEDNGRAFKRITKEPIVNTFTKENPDSKYHYKMDSIANYKKYSYRIKGITAFGEVGPASETVEGEGTKLIESTAQITTHQIAPNNSVSLNWQFDEQSENLIDGFVVQRANSSNGPFNTIKLETNVSSRNYIDITPMPTNYYKVGLMVNDRESNFSFPYLVQLEDSIPPAIPTGMLALIDTTGAVTLTWQANTEPDLLGYRVYRSNFKSSEFAQITSSPISGTELVDSINLKTLTSKIYYTIASVDYRNNTSAFSETIEVIKPDIVPPVPAVFKSVTSNKDGIHLQWINSSSEDIASHALFRRKQNKENWLLIIKISSLDSVSFTDNSIEPMQQYQYTLVATDKNGLESIPTVPVTATKTYAEFIKFTEFNFLLNKEKKQIELTWQIDSQEPIGGVLVYRSKEDAPLSLLKKVEAGTNGFLDNEVSINTVYTYRIKAVFTNGGFSAWSEKLSVKY